MIHRLGYCIYRACKLVFLAFLCFPLRLCHKLTSSYKYIIFNLRVFSVMTRGRVQQLGALLPTVGKFLSPPPLVWALPVKLLICLSKYNLKVANSASLYLSLFIAQAGPRLPQAPPPSHQYTRLLWEYFKVDLKRPPEPKWLSSNRAPKPSANSFEKLLQREEVVNILILWEITVPDRTNGLITEGSQLLVSIMLKSSQIPRAVQSSKLYKILLSVFLASLISDFFACVTPLAGSRCDS